MRKKFLDQVQENYNKLDMLRMMWNEELDLFRAEAFKSKAKDRKEKQRELLNIDEDTKDLLLKKYLARCKFLYALGFFQWRSANVKGVN